MDLSNLGKSMGWIPLTWMHKMGKGVEKDIKTGLMKKFWSLWLINIIYPKTSNTTPQDIHQLWVFKYQCSRNVPNYFFVNLLNPGKSRGFLTFPFQARGSKPTRGHRGRWRFRLGLPQQTVRCKFYRKNCNLHFKFTSVFL